MPMTKEFRPVGDISCKSAVILTEDEYESIRLIDKQGFSQEDCSAYMQVARTTAQMSYGSARKKPADALVSNLTLRIEGGYYQLCDGTGEYCGCRGCTSAIAGTAYNGADTRETVTPSRKKTPDQIS